MLQHFYGTYKLHKLESGTPKHFRNPNSFIEVTASHLKWPIWTSVNKKLSITGNCIEQPSQHDQNVSQAESPMIAIAGMLLANNSKNTLTDEKYDRKWLATKLVTGSIRSLAEANGTFAAAIYIERTDQLYLASDSLGGRPLYYMIDGSTLLFSTYFSFLIQASHNIHKLSRRAIAEEFTFCYPLHSRTPSESISVLRDSECLCAHDNNFRTTRYFDWSKQQIVARDKREELEYAATAIHDAVLANANSEQTQYSLLSGGLDLRVLVALLRQNGKKVHAATVAFTNTLDHKYAHAFASAHNIALIDVERPATALETSPSRRTASLLSAATSRFSEKAVFSGDGGGETLGMLMIDAALLQILRSHGIPALIREYCKHALPPVSLMPRKVAAEMIRYPIQGMTEEFHELSDMQPEKAFQLFLLRNDLRRHMHEYFESLAKERCELLLPFYDKRVLGSVLRITPPFDNYIRHAFYYQLLTFLPSSIRKVRWQAYPRSLPCPVDGIDVERNQWNNASELFVQAACQWRREALLSILQKKVPRDLILRHRVLGAALLDVLRVREYGYLFMNYLAIEKNLRKLSVR